MPFDKQTYRQRAAIIRGDDRAPEGAWGRVPEREPYPLETVSAQEVAGWIEQIRRVSPRRLGVPASPARRVAGRG